MEFFFRLIRPSSCESDGLLSPKAGNSTGKIGLRPPRNDIEGGQPAGRRYKRWSCQEGNPPEAPTVRDRIHSLPFLHRFSQTRESELHSPFPLHSPFSLFPFAFSPFAFLFFRAVPRVPWFLSLPWHSASSVVFFLLRIP
ncbi:MAG: hypothetical protein D6679_05100 [Candidatus Hydrogenedentota bacterium]|nr:MAG: hypothetical protein D6679_05100 [Candidatus Hydrogenedentota bacterium]